MSNGHTNISKLQPELYKTTIALSQQAEAAALDTGLSAQLVELVKIRVSQINGCTFCMRMHTKNALDKGATLEQVAVLPAWRETDDFDDFERDALALAERVTNISGSPRAEQLEPTTTLTQSQAAAVAWGRDRHERVQSDRSHQPLRGCASDLDHVRRGSAWPNESARSSCA